MSTVSKLAYYDAEGMAPAVARHYYRQLGPARRILDVGCGTGTFGRHRADAVVEVHGVDVDAGAVARAQEHEIALTVDLDTERLPYEDGHFDAVLAKDVLEHLEQPQHLLAEVHRVLAPGGVLLVSVVMARPRRVWADYTHVRGFTLRAATMLLADAGFVVERSWRMGGVPLSARLNAIRAVPYFLLLPVANQLWAASWELRARRRS